MRSGHGSCGSLKEAPLHLKTHSLLRRRGEAGPQPRRLVPKQAADLDIIPVGSVLTMVGTGSEMNCGSVITNHEAKMKVGHVFADARVFPKFAVLNP